MLIELNVENFALIDKLRLEFSSGFSVLTGETGAGKSIIVDALGAALGERTGTDVIRTGTETCLVEAVFDVTDSPAAVETARNYGFEPEDGLMILSREINASGRSQSRVNGRTTTTTVLREITSMLIDVHGQHEHQSLLSVPLHIDLLDSWAGETALKLREHAQDLYTELSGLISEREKLQTDERERARMLDLYKFQVEEIQAAKLDPNEEEELVSERIRLANAEKLYDGASEVYTALGGAERGAVDSLSDAAGLAEKLARIDPSMTELVEQINTALFGAQEALMAVRDYRDRVEANPARLEQVEERLDLIRLLKRKYGDTIQEILDYCEGLGTKIDDLENAEERSHELDAKIEDLRGRLALVAAELTKVRSEASSSFEQAVEKELADLAMAKTRFEVSIRPIEPGPKGADAVEFLISPNPGEPVKPLAKIASGGEMSRIMLALKTVMAGAQVPTLVFDEIDTGIGGRTAQVLGEKLATLAEKCQVLCVTHLPQIASKAGTHYTVEKVVEGERTKTVLRSLTGEDRVTELARMLGGEESSAAAAQHAREMLSLADKRND